jgi:hypothetical protein
VTSRKSKVDSQGDPDRKRPPRLTSSLSFVDFPLAVATGIVRDRHSRRAVLFGAVLASLLMAFVGTVLIAGPLAASPWIFLLYWGVCILLTFFSVLLAVHDLLILAQEARRESERLKAELLSRRDADQKRPE